MQMITTIGLDLAKSVFQVHGVDAGGQVIVRRQLKRRYVLTFFQKLMPCLVGIEACASSHHWSRELQELGHTVPAAPHSPRGGSCRPDVMLRRLNGASWPGFPPMARLSMVRPVSAANPARGGWHLERSPRRGRCESSGPHWSRRSCDAAGPNEHRQG